MEGIKNPDILRIYKISKLNQLLQIFKQYHNFLSTINGLRVETGTRNFASPLRHF
jgi:hypothetical protein